jgi:hypothetical protein
LTPQDLKLGVTDALNALLEPIRQEFASNAAFRESFELAYPKPAKKIKKVKEKGSKYPGKIPDVKSAEQTADGPISEAISKGIINDGPATGGGQTGVQIQAVGKDVEDAFSKLHVSNIPK